MDQRSVDTTAVQVAIYSDFARVRALLCQTAHSDGAGADVFETLPWFEHLAAHGFVERQTLLLACVTEAGADAATVLPLRACAAGLCSLSNYYSSLYGPLQCGTLSPAAWLSLARVLRRRPGTAVVDLQPLASDAAWLSDLAAALRTVGFWVGSYRCFGNWYLPVVHAGFAAYMASLPSPLRHSIERGRRRLARAGSFSLAVHHTPGEALEQAVAHYETVYARSWKQAEPCPQFMPGLVRMAARQGWLRLGVLLVQGDPVAAQVWLVKDGKANIYKLAYVQGFERFSPGSVLTAELMAHVIDVDRVREIDYLTGDDAYKRDWMSHRRERVGLVAFDPMRPRGLAAALRHFGGQAWRRLRTRPTATPPG